VRSQRTRRARGSRREFLKLASAGAAAALTAPALALAAETKKAATKGPAAKASQPSAAVKKGIEEQKGYVKSALAAIRKYELPTNSEQALVFTPMKAER
jgi:hypothetical protein